MPNYEYDCPKCGSFEISQRITDAPLTHHECGEPVERRISRTAFLLKGGGWHSEGYGTKGAAEPPCKTGGCDAGGCPAKA